MWEESILIMTKLIAYLTSILVAVVALMAFALSYHALQGVALSNGIPLLLSYVWPLLIDFALVVFSLCVVTAHLHGESTWRQWVLVGLATVLTCTYNYLHAPDNLVAQSVAVVPPVMLFFSFELLAMQLKNSIQRTRKVQDLTQQVTTLKDTIDNPILIRRQQVATLKDSITQADIAKQLGVSISTIRNDLKVLNGHH